MTATTKRFVFLTDEEFDDQVRIGSPKAVLAKAEVRMLEQTLSAMTQAKKKGGARARGGKRPAPAAGCKVVYCVVLKNEVICRVRCS